MRSEVPDFSNPVVAWLTVVRRSPPACSCPDKDPTSTNTSPVTGTCGWNTEDDEGAAKSAARRSLPLPLPDTAFFQHSSHPRRVERATPRSEERRVGKE